MRISENLKIRANHLVFLDNEAREGLNALLVREVYFTQIDDSLYLASSLIKILKLRREQNQLVEICDDLSHCYMHSGLIIPPFTIYSDIYKMPVFSKFINSNGVFQLEFDVSYLNAKPFVDDESIFASLSEILAKNLAAQSNDRVVCTLSGGADSAVLISLLTSVFPAESIDALCCEMPNLNAELVKARRISKVLDVNFISYCPTGIDPKPLIDRYARDYGNLLFDPVVPVISSMLEDYRNRHTSSENEHVSLFEGQGADTVMFGLPHATTLAIYSWRLNKLFLILSKMLPESSSTLRNRSRFLYRVVKSVHLLSEKTWQRSVLKSLDVDMLKDTPYYRCYEGMLNEYFRQTKDHQKSLVLFFLQIISTRELQKYQLLGPNIKALLPFMDQSFVSRCLSSKTSLFFSFPYRKKPIFNLALKVYGKIFKSRKTYPFIVKYPQNKQLDARSQNDVDDNFIFRARSLASIAELVKK
jgi:asparagine synthetase B (glutamine-hydrolysing)